MKKIKVSSEFLKWLALISMTTDHIDRIYIKLGWLSDSLGRMAFPLFSFLLISNFVSYHPVKKYLVRLGSFALLTQLLFYFFHFESKNVLFSFFNAILFIVLTEKISKIIKNFYIQTYFIMMLLCGFLPLILCTDYSVFGFFFLLALYAYMQNMSKINYLSVLVTSIFLNLGNPLSVFITTLTVVVLLSAIQMVKSHRRIHWRFFYLYYPLHKIVLHILKELF